MPKLMPQAMKRCCPGCGHAWTTAYFGPTACPNPSCGMKLIDCSAGAPHVCAEGHGHPHGGECPTCRKGAHA